MTDTIIDRRRFTTGLGAGLVAAVAGCMDDGESSDETSSDDSDGLSDDGDGSDDPSTDENETTDTDDGSDTESDDGGTGTDSDDGGLDNESDNESHAENESGDDSEVEF